MFRRRAAALACALVAFSNFVAAQQQCYFGPGAANRGPANLVPCLNSGQSACCLLGDTCLSGNTCYNYASGDLYQYGCTDITYSDDSCPYKCGFNTTLSPWTALEYCNDVANVTDTWVCHAPESCGCEWKPSDSLLILQPRGCKEMGTDARVALYAPSALAPYVSLPSTYHGTTSYYSGTTVNGTSTWVQTAIAGYTPATVTQLTTYGDQPSSAVLILPGRDPAPATNPAASSVPSASAGTSSTAAPETSLPTATPTSSPSSNTTSPTIAPNTTSSGLSTGAKAGIGVGVAGGVCLIAAVAIAAFLWGKRQRKRKAQEMMPPPQQASQYGPGSPPMPQPYYPSTPGEKPPGWQPQYPMGMPPQMQQASYFDPNAQSPYHHDVRQPMYAGVPSPPLMGEIARKQVATAPPMELSAEQAAPSEMESSPVKTPPTPAPAYADVGR